MCNMYIHNIHIYHICTLACVPSVQTPDYICIRITHSHIYTYTHTVYVIHIYRCIRASILFVHRGTWLYIYINSSHTHMHYINIHVYSYSLMGVCVYISKRKCVCLYVCLCIYWQICVSVYTWASKYAPDRRWCL